MDLVEIAGDPLNLPRIQARSLVLECEYDPVHPDFYWKIDNQSEALPYARQDRGVLPVMIA